MKKLLSFLAIPILFFACKTNTEDDTLSAEEWSKFPTYTKEKVVEMQRFYFDSIPLTKNNVIGVVTISNPPLKRMLRGKDRFILIVGAYLVDTLEKKRGDRALIVGFKDNSKFSFYDFSTLFPKPSLEKSGGTVCPPPDPPCNIESME